MNKLRDCAIVLGLAGMLVMIAADTKDVEATGRISYESESSSLEGLMTAGAQITEYSNTQILIFEWEEEQAREKELAALAEEAEESGREGPQEPEIQESSSRVIELPEADYTALLKLVEAEASGEDLKGKMLVANVVLNRVENEAFPDTVEAVIYQKEGGKAQFSPVATGKIERVSISEETVEAVERVLCGEDESEGALYFVSRTYASQKSLRWFERNLTRLFVYRGHEFYA